MGETWGNSKIQWFIIMFPIRIYSIAILRRYSPFSDPDMAYFRVQNFAIVQDKSLTIDIQWYKKQQAHGKSVLWCCRGLLTYLDLLGTSWWISQGLSKHIETLVPWWLCSLGHGSAGYVITGAMDYPLVT